MYVSGNPAVLRRLPLCYDAPSSLHWPPTKMMTAEIDERRRRKRRRRGRKERKKKKKKKKSKISKEGRIIVRNGSELRGGYPPLSSKKEGPPLPFRLRPY
jgi:hypothetical protein